MFGTAVAQMSEQERTELALFLEGVFTQPKLSLFFSGDVMTQFFQKRTKKRPFDSIVDQMQEAELSETVEFLEGVFPTCPLVLRIPLLPKKEKLLLKIKRRNNHKSDQCRKRRCSHT